MRPGSRCCLLCVLLVVAQTGFQHQLRAQAQPGGAGASDLERGFADPPASARTRCFWWWLNGNVTKPAITRDLEELKAKGFGGALIFDAGGAEQAGNRPVPAGPLFGSPEWQELFAHAVREADRLGLELSLSIQSGWNLGGPDITPEEAAKQLTWSKATFQGPGAIDATLPVPRSRDGYYRDIAVLACPSVVATATATPPRIVASSSQADFPPALAADGKDETFWVSAGTGPGQGPTPEHPEWLERAFDPPRRLIGTRVLGRPGYGPKACALEVSRDGKTFETVSRFTLRDREPAEVRVAPVEARIVRLVCQGAHDPGHPDAPRNVQVAAWSLLGPDGHPFDDFGPRPIRDLGRKAMFQELGGSAPDCRGLLLDVEPIPGEPVIRRAEIVDLTDRVDPDGRLRWDAPEGSWEVFRFGYTVTDARVSTASGRWQGRVVDYMSTPVIETYWGRHVRPLLDLAGPLAGKTLKYLHTDSWECGGMNWTPGFAGEFRRRRGGYDPTPYLPVIGGRIVEGRDVSNRFLADFRKTLGDCVAENHYQVFARLAHRRGLGIHPESGGPHAGPFDALKCLGRSDIPMGEFWAPSPHRPTPPDRFFVKQAASAAHIYDRRFVGAEGFTSIGPHWVDSLGKSLKPSFDHEACAGLNLTFIHTVTCSPVEMGRPGQEYFAGTHFNPNVTWWDQAGAFVAYLNRCQFLLQQGRFVADACYYYGDHVPNLVRLKEADPAGVLPGHDYDIIDEEVLLGRLRVEDGRLTLPHGMSYRLLVLPDHRVLSLDALRKVHQLVRDGATVSGPRPLHDVSLVGYPESETQFARLVTDLWGEDRDKDKDAGPSGEHRFGDGRVIWGVGARQVLAVDGIAPDFEAEGETGLDYLHRTLGDGDGEIYFVSHRGPRATGVVACRFRVAGRRPELWDPVRGTTRPLPAFRQADGRTTVPLEFDPYGSLFVVFRTPIAADAQGTSSRNFPEVVASDPIAGPWSLRFDPNRGGPGQGPGPVVLDRLVNWADHPDPAIRYYSGTATYATTFDLPRNRDIDATGGRWRLDLGDVRELAVLRLNGKDLGVSWTAPFRVDITEVVRPRGNRLEIDVVNTWRNRLVGDRDRPPDRRTTRTNINILPGWQPIASGLLGPVRLEAAR